jgi:hypothetical protein
MRTAPKTCVFDSKEGGIPKRRRPVLAGPAWRPPSLPREDWVAGSALSSSPWRIYRPKYVRHSCRDCAGEGRRLPSASTTSSARSLCADGRLGGSFQLSRARMWSCILVFELVISSVRRFNSRTCSSNVWNTSSSIDKTGQHPSLKKTRRAVTLGGTSMERVRPPQSGHTPTFEGSLSTRKGPPSVGSLSELAPASLS